MKYKGRTRFGERRVGDEVKPRLKPDSIYKCKAVKNEKKSKNMRMSMRKSMRKNRGRGRGRGRGRDRYRKREE